MNNRSKIKVNANFINQRLDNFLFRELRNIPKSLIYRLLRKGAIKVNNKRKKPDYRLLLDDEIWFPNLEGADLDKKTGPKTLDSFNPALIKQIKSRIVYENDDFLILNKPAGLSVHGGSKIKVGLIDILRSIYGEKFYLELVHRLDRDTSGCLLIAKNRLALNDLSALFRESNIKKTYLALVDGLWPNSKKIIDLPLRRSVLQGGERMVMVDPEFGKPSITRVEIRDRNKNTSLLQLSPISGRTHQLRVHLAHEKCPIIGDDKYGHKEFNKTVKAHTNLNRMFLHAFSLEFTWNRGTSGNNLISVTAPLDKDLEKTLNFYGYI